jgi:hypothetical protein
VKKQFFNPMPKLASFFYSLNTHHREHHLYAHMLREDIVTGIMPLGGRSRYHPNFTASIQGVENEINSARELIASFSERGTRDLNEIISRAIEEIARALSWKPSSLYEIVNTQKSVSIHPVSSRRTFRLPFYTFQVIPRADQQTWRRKILHQSNRYIWSISIPKALGGAKGYREMISRLEKIPPASTPQFVMQELENSVEPSIFDFNEYSALHKLYINKATSNWNWHRRDWSDDTQCEYYRTYKRAMFKYAQNLLREHIVSELNILLQRLGLNCTILISGLPSAAEILESANDLHLGTINFEEMYKLVFD